MSKKSYLKTPLTYEQQLKQLKSRKLYIENDEKALHLLKHLSYYRLSGYWHTLLKEPKNSHQFKKGATFNQAFSLYSFDRELRLLLLNQIEKIEISIRAVIIYECSRSWGTFWLSDKDNFNSHSKYSSTINKLFGELRRSNEYFLENYNKTYIEELPPSWITLEVCSFGSLSWVYSIIKPGKTKRNIANRFGMNEKVFQSWLHSLVYIRNICAHHSRLWNKKITIKPEFPKNTSFPWINNLTIKDTRTGNDISIKNRSYFAICMIKYILQNINPNNTFKEKLICLITKHQQIDLNALGFTNDWKNEPLWK